MTTSIPRRQQTLARAARVSGFGLFNGCDVTVEFCPADEGHGVVFERTDLSESVLIPALIENVVAQNRCTVISRQGASVSVIEHVMAALAGLRVDNCLVRIDAPEPPAGDGSSQIFVEALLHAGIVQQHQLRRRIRVNEALTYLESSLVGIAVQPAREGDYQIGFLLDYGPGPIPLQALNLAITPSTFFEQLARSRTFVLQTEVEQLRAAGLGRRAGPENVLVFTGEGVLENSLRWPDECVRHKILDCVGDFALLGCDLEGHFTASRSGHRLNHEIIRQIQRTCSPDASLADSVPMKPISAPALLTDAASSPRSPHFGSSSSVHRTATLSARSESTTQSPW